MGLFRRLDERTKKLSYWNLKAIGWVGVAIGLMLAKIPCVADVSIWWWVAIAVVLYAWVLWAFFRK